MDETKVIFNKIKNRYGHKTMLDVGALGGSSCMQFLRAGWKVYAFEPNPVQYRILNQLKNRNPTFKNRFVVEQLAVNDKDEENLSFYLSDVSKGISSLTPFHKSHVKQRFTVNTVRLDTYMEQKEIKNVSFLKIDTEGHDFMVLKSYPWTIHKPEVVECEFEDLKTVDHLGYSWRDMAEFLKDKGYHVVVSEWHPIVRYGTQHKWNKFKRYPCDLDKYEAWGNLLAFKDKNLADSIVK